MDVLTQIQRLINIKKSFINVLANIGYAVRTFQEIISSIENHKQGDLDKALMSALTAENEAVRMDESVYNLYERLFAHNETLLSSIDTLASKSFYETNLVYFKSKPCNAVINDAFKYCRSLMFAELDQATDCTTLNSTFRWCSNLVAIELPPSLDKCKDLQYTFSICTSLRKVNLPKQLPACTSMAYLFENCRNLDIDIEFTYLPKVTKLDIAFSGCSSLRSVTLPTEMPALNSMNSAFRDCRSLSSVTLPTKMPALTSLYEVFNGCSSLSSVTLPTEMPALTSLYKAFAGCSSLITPLDIDCTNVLIIKECQIFSGCKKIPSLTLHSTANIHNFSYFIYNCTSLTSVTGLDLSNAFLSVDEVKQVAAANKITLTDADAKTVYKQTSWIGCTKTNTKLTNMPLQGTLYRSGFSIASCPLTAESLYTWFVALYDWTNNPEAKTTDDTTHTLTVNATSLANMQAYTPAEGLSGEAIYKQALDRGWIIATA